MTSTHAKARPGGLDTNVLVRYVTADDPAQFEAARRFIEEECTPAAPGLISPIVLCELVWVLRSAYEVPKEDLIATLDTLLRVNSLQVLDMAIVRRALTLYREHPVDFADAYLHVHYQDAGAYGPVTFDRKASSLFGARRLGSD